MASLRPSPRCAHCWAASRHPQTFKLTSSPLELRRPQCRLPVASRVKPQVGMVQQPPMHVLVTHTSPIGPNGVFRSDQCPTCTLFDLHESSSRADLPLLAGCVHRRFICRSQKQPRSLCNKSFLHASQQFAKERHEPRKAVWSQMLHKQSHSVSNNDHTSHFRRKSIAYASLRLHLPFTYSPIRKPFANASLLIRILQGGSGFGQFRNCFSSLRISSHSRLTSGSWPPSQTLRKSADAKHPRTMRSDSAACTPHQYAQYTGLNWTLLLPWIALNSTNGE